MKKEDFIRKHDDACCYYFDGYYSSCIEEFLGEIYDDFEAEIKAKEERIKDLEEAMKPKTCEWKQCTSEYDTSWEGTCSVKWLLIDGTPTENHMQFCPKCGLKLVEIEPKDNA